jgi:hypothetical protein
MPQFILFTHDDAVIPSTADMLHLVVDGRSANGCPLTATLFTQVQGTGVEAAGFRRHLTPAVTCCCVFHVVHCWPTAAELLCFQLSLRRL